MYIYISSIIYYSTIIVLFIDQRSISEENFSQYQQHSRVDCPIFGRTYQECPTGICRTK